MPLDRKINSKTVVQPDLMVVVNDFNTTHLEFTPSLTIEIVSTSTAFKDSHEKFELYEMEGVKYYLIVDPEFKKIEVYQLIDKKYHLVAITPDSFEFSFNNGCKEPVNINFAGTWD